MKRICLNCGKEFDAQLKEVNKGNAKYCNLSCSAQAMHKKYPQSGNNNFNWKGGISTNAVRYTRKYKASRPDAVEAHSKVYTEIRAGRIARQPCQICGNDKADAHHEDYSKPLEVKWLCRKHHNELHRKTG